jgi:hypothetical protein
MTTPAVHILKSWPAYFKPMVQGLKRFEWRVFDRSFAEGDFLHLQEWDPTLNNGTGGYTGADAWFRVTYLLTPATGAAVGLPAGYCIMSVAPVGATAVPPSSP